MSNNAYLIKHPNNNNNFICNICCLKIDSDKIIGLKCNSKKHVFCFDCINDWYKVIQTNMNKSINSNYNFIRMCPICRKNGGFLPDLDNESLKNIHYTNEELKQTCGYKLKKKDDYCMNLGQKCYNNLCKKHYCIVIKDNKQTELNKNIFDSRNSLNDI